VSEVSQTQECRNAIQFYWYTSISVSKAITECDLCHWLYAV